MNRNLLILMVFYIILSSVPQNLKAMDNDLTYPLIDMPADYHAVNLNAVRPNLCTKVTNAGKFCLIFLKDNAQSLKNKAGTLVTAVANRIIGMPLIQSATQTIRNSAPIIVANKNQLIASALLALTASSVVYAITDNTDAFYLVLPIFNGVINYCERASVRPVLKNLILQPLILRSPYKYLNNTGAFFVWGLLRVPRRGPWGTFERQEALTICATIPGLMAYQVGTFIVGTQTINMPVMIPEFFAFLFSFSKMERRTNLNRSLLIEAIDPAIPRHLNWAQSHFDRHFDSRRPGFANLLIKLGAEVNVVDPHIHTPLQLAVRTNQLPLVKALLNNRAQVDFASYYFPMTPLMNAIVFNRIDIVKELLMHNADATKEIPLQHMRGMNCMSFAKNLNFEEIWSFLREKRYADLAPLMLDYFKIRDLVLLVIDYE